MQLRSKHARGRYSSIVELFVTVVALACSLNTTVELFQIKWLTQQADTLNEIVTSHFCNDIKTQVANYTQKHLRKAKPSC